MIDQQYLARAVPAISYGELIRHDSFHSKILNNSRTLIVYLPPGYHADQRRRYPVLYFQDGQNLFDGSTSYIPGQHWRLNETADYLINAGEAEPVIIVGIYNAGSERIAEYTPSADPNFKVGGRADLYGRMLVEEVKPFIDGEYRTLAGAANTGIGGSSLGGLVSLYLGLRHPETFGKLAVLSPSLWWDRQRMLREVVKLKAKPPVRVWLCVGTEEGRSGLTHAAKLRDKLNRLGFELGDDLKFMAVEGGRHTEKDWACRADHVLRFLFPRQD